MWIERKPDAFPNFFVVVFKKDEKKKMFVYK